MKYRIFSKKFISLVLILTLFFTGVEAYLTYRTRRSDLRDAMSLHIAEITSNVNFAVERLYAVQTLVVAVDDTDLQLETLVPVLKQDAPSRFIRSISIAPNGIVSQVYPAEGNEPLIGMNFFSQDHDFASDSWEAVRTGRPVITDSFLLPDGQRAASIRLEVEAPDETGEMKDWGMVSVCVAFPDILQEVTEAPLEEQGYAYRLFFQKNVRTTKSDLFTVGESDFSDPVSSTFYLVNRRLVLEAQPEAGWLTPPELALSFLHIGSILLVLGVVLNFIYLQLTKLRKDASQDTLTRLTNRAAAAKQIDRILQSKSFSKGAFLMMDLDNFKAVNDTFGHERGDEVLIRCAEQLQLLFRSDDILCRLGGDEFVAFLPFHSDMTFLNGKIERLLRAMRRDVVGDGAIVPISASVGIAIAPDHGTSFDQLYHHADEALYRSKQRGRDTATVYGEFVYRHPADPGGSDQSFQARNCILIVDDDFINREVLKNIFSRQYRIEEATNGHEGLQKIEEHLDRLSAVLLDVNMPGMGGMELLTILHQRGIPYTVPVFLVTSHDDLAIAQEAYEMGVMDVIAKPVTPFVILRRVQSVIELYQARSALSATVQTQAKTLQESLDTIDALHRGTIEVLASAIEFRDTESGEHTNRIYAITKHILTHTAMGEGLSAEEVEDIAVGSIMHDIGKIAVSDVILNKPGKLTKEEFEIMKTHTTKGADLMDRLSRMQHHPAYRYARDITRHHHERWDGSGYPDGLQGEEITVWSQVVSIADVYDALVSPRVYKKPISPDKAVEMIAGGECGAFNPKLVECFLQAEPEIRSWYSDDHLSAAPYLSSGWDSRLFPPKEEERDLGDTLLLTAAMQTFFDMMISANLTQNRFSILDYERFQTHCADYDGVFDDLIAAGASSVPESHRQQFVDTFSRESLLEAFARGQRAVQLIHPQYSDAGELLQVATYVLMMEDPRTGDIRQVTLARYL